MMIATIDANLRQINNIVDNFVNFTILYSLPNIITFDWIIYT